MAPATATSLTCWPAELMSLSYLSDEGQDRSDNVGVILSIDNTGVNPTEQIGMATVRHGKAAGLIATSKGEAIADLMLEGAQFFFRIRAVGQSTGLITSWGGGAFGFMRSLALIGPLTVPQIAQMRPTSRQRMQRLADELAAEGLVEFIDNPKHRRSKLVQLTPKGLSRYRTLNVQLLAIASTLGVSLIERDIRRASESVRLLSDEMKGRSERRCPM